MPVPYWINSPYVSTEFGNWTISEDAPQQLKDDFNAWMKEYSELEEKGIYI